MIGRGGRWVDIILAQLTRMPHLTRGIALRTSVHIYSCVKSARESSFNKSLLDTILNFIKGAEHARGPDLTHKARSKRNFCRDDFVVCVHQLWQNDWHDFDHERYRVGMHLALLFHCNTSGRRAEYEKVLRYSDITPELFYEALLYLLQCQHDELVMNFEPTHPFPLPFGFCIDDGAPCHLPADASSST